MKITRSLYIGAMILLLIGVTGCMSEKGKTDEMLKYLNQKYNKEFAAVNFIKGSQVFPELYGADKITAYPKDNPEQIFLTYESSKNKKVFYDNYMLAKWADELRINNSRAVSELFSKDALFKVVFNVASDKYDISLLNISVYDYLKTNNDVNVTFKIAVKCVDKPEIAKYQDQLLQVYNLVKSLNTTEYGISIGFVDSKEDFSDYIRTANVNNTPWNNLNMKVYGYVTINETSEIKTSADILNLYKQVEE